MISVKDGEVDYTGYSRKDLLQALDAIDRVRFPKNLEKLQKALLDTPIREPTMSSPVGETTTIAELAIGFSISVLLLIALKVLVAVAPQLSVYLILGDRDVAHLSNHNGCRSCAPGGN